MAISSWLSILLSFIPFLSLFPFFSFAVVGIGPQVQYMSGKFSSTYAPIFRMFLSSHEILLGPWLAGLFLHYWFCCEFPYDYQHRKSMHGTQNNSTNTFFYIVAYWGTTHIKSAKRKRRQEAWERAWAYKDLLIHKMSMATSSGGMGFRWWTYRDLQRQVHPDYLFQVFVGPSWWSRLFFFAVPRYI